MCVFFMYFVSSNTDSDMQSGITIGIISLAFVCNHHYTTMVHCVGVSIGGVIIAVILVVVIVLILLLCCKHLKKHDIEGQPSTTVSAQHMIIIIMTNAVYISLFIAGQLC